MERSELGCEPVRLSSQGVWRRMMYAALPLFLEGLFQMLDPMA